MEVISKALVSAGIDEKAAKEYASALVADGFDSLRLLSLATEADLRGCGISRTGHIRAVMGMLHSSLPDHHQEMMRPVGYEGAPRIVAVSSDGVFSGAYETKAAVAARADYNMSSTVVTQLLSHTYPSTMLGFRSVVHLIETDSKNRIVLANGGVCPAIFSAMLNWGGHGLVVKEGCAAIIAMVGDGTYAQLFGDLGACGFLAGVLRIYGQEDYDDLVNVLCRTVCKLARYNDDNVKRFRNAGIAKTLDGMPETADSMLVYEMMFIKRGE